MADEEERQRKLEYGKKKLALYRQRKARLDGQNLKKQKKEKISSLNINQQNDATSINSSQCVESAGNPDSTRMRALPSGRVENHAKGFTEEEELGIDNSHSEQGAQSSQACLKMTKNESAGKEHEIEELTQQLQVMSGTEVLKRLQEFEAAVKQRDCIITQLIANLQQVTKEKDETMKEFLELTEQSKKLQIQFQRVSETLWSSTHSSTAAELLQAKQQLERQDHRLKDYQIKEEEFKTQITFLQEKFKVYEMELDKKVENSTNEVREKQAIIEALNTRIIEEEKKTAALSNKVTTADKLVEDLKEQLTKKDQETESFKLELANSKKKEKQYLLEIKQWMGSVEELQRKNLKENLETSIVQKMEKETQWKLDQLQAELDEMYGKQIVQMKQELIKQHMSQLEDLKSQHKGEMENTFKSYSDAIANEEQLKLMNVAMSDLNIKLQDILSQKEKLREELCVVKGEKCALQSQFDNLLEESGLLRDQIQRARQIIAEQESKLNEAYKSLSTVESLKAEIAAASETKKEMELKHDAEIINYKIKLEMLEKEKNAVLDRMAESQEAELERLRTQLLFSHEEELHKLKDDLEAEHRLNIEKLKDNLGIHHRQQIDILHNEMSKKMETMQCEKDNLVTKQSQLMSEISELRDVQESHTNSKLEEMALQINELKGEIEILRHEEKEKGALEQEIQELQLKTELLKEQLKEKEEELQKKCAQIEAENNLLTDEKNALEDMMKSYTPTDQVKRLIALKENSWQEEVEILSKENEDLIEQCSHLNNEIEKQRNTFSFAEKNFEVNYQELKEEYACLLRVKDDLEDNQTKQALQYEGIIKALTEELHLQKGKHSDLTDDKTFVAEPLEVSEVVEKDSTELMEKLKVTEREKVELSEKLSVISEQLKQTRDQVDSLSAEVRLLSQDKEQLLFICKALEVPTNPKGTENATECPVPLNSSQAGLVTVTGSHHEGFDSQISEDLSKEIKIIIEDEIPFKESGEEELMLLTAGELSRGGGESREKEKLQQELCIVQAKQDDLRLQMEAQRICLSLVYSTYADQVRHAMEKERDEALRNLKDELVSAQEKEMAELHKVHQCQLQALQTQETDDGKEPLQVLVDRLQKAVSKECHYISETLNSSLDEHHTPLKCEMNVEEKENSGVYSHNQRLNLQEYRYQVQDFQDNMQTLLNKVTDEYSKLVILQTRLSKIDGQQTNGVELDFAEESVAKEEAEFLSVHSSANLWNTDVGEGKVSSLPEGEKSRDREEQVQGLESPGSSLQRQLKEAEMPSGAETQSSHGRLQIVHGVAVQPSLCIDSVVFKESDVQETVDNGNCLNEHIASTTKFPGGFEERKETGMVKLMEKQYQERLEEEIAKVIVSMSIAFAQQTELSRLSEEKENSIQSEQAHRLCWQEHPFNDITSQGQVGPHIPTRTDKNVKEQFKPLSKELEEHRKEVLLSNDDDLDDDILKSKDHGLTISQEIFSKDKPFVVRQCIHDEVSIIETSRQLEDMRQELVRQYEEHQQATELLRQAHMQQMERQREDQEQLQEEVQRLSMQLAQKSSISSENVSERERVLLEELEALKQLCLAGREELCCELHHSCTQTQDENDNQDVEKQIFKEKTLERKPEDDTTPDENLSNERHALQKANNKLVKILLEVAKTTAAAEETIGCHGLGILDRSSKGQPAASLLWRSEAELSAKPCGQVTDESIPSYPGSAIARSDSKWSQVTEQATELPQQFGTSGLAGPEIDPENVELITNVSSRLQTAVEKLLDAISEMSSQLEHAKVIRTELMHESFKQKQETAESLRCLEELHERLQEELRAREQLAVELNRAESIIDGYSDEKTVFEREIREKTYIIDRLEQELLCASTRLQELEAEQQQRLEEQELLSRQKAAMRAMAGPLEQRPVAAAVDAAPGEEFLQETEKLLKEKLEVQCQAEKIYNELQKQVKFLEIDIEEKTNKLIEMEQEKNVELTDLKQQNQALEKQLEKMRRFVDEQAFDRENERDVFQLEIQKLEQQLKVVPRLQPASEQQTREFEQLTTHLKEKTDRCSELLLCKEQLQRHVQERNEEIEKLECRVQELEQALLLSVNDQKQSGGVEAKPELSLEVQLQAERDAIDRKEREITNLEEQLEQFREELENKNDEVQELHMQLEIQRKESTTCLQELQQENKLFKDEMKKLEFALKESNPEFAHDQPLFEKFAQIIQEKDAKINQLNEQFIKLEQQLKLTTDNKASSIPRLAYSNVHQTREICSSDSESDWGQGFDTASEGQEEAESSADPVPKVVKGLLRAVHTEGLQVLSVADLPDDEGEGPSAQQASHSWLEERRAYLSTISSLKDLISKMQVQRQTEDVLLKERSILLAAFRTDMTPLDIGDVNGLLNSLEQRIQEQGIEYQTAMECLQKADRRSTVAEIEALPAQINGREITLNKGQESSPSSPELLDCSMQQSRVLEMHDHICAIRDSVAKLQENLRLEKKMVSEFKSGLSKTCLVLENTLKAQREQQKELEAFRLQVNSKADEVLLLSDTLASKHKKSHERQSDLATEKAKSGHCEERDKELEDLRFTLEDQKQRNTQLDVLWRQQGEVLNELVQKLESQQMLYNAQLSEEQGRNLELRALLESERVRIQEMKDTLDKEQELHAQLQGSGDGEQLRPFCPPKELLEELQQQLEEKEKHIMELVIETQKYKLDYLQTKYQMENERHIHQKILQMEKEANILGQRNMEELQSKVEELQCQLQEKRHQQATWNLTTDDRTRNWVLQQKLEEEAKGTSYAELVGRQIVDKNDLQLIRQKLQHVATKLQQHVAKKAYDSLELEVLDEDALTWVRERIDRIILQLQRLTCRPDDEESLASSSTSCGSLTETLLKQNSELTGHVNRLTEEKNNLRSIIRKLEEEIKFYEQTRAGGNDSSGLSLDVSGNIEDVIASEKEVWSKEKLTLQKSLKRAEAKVCELKAKLRNDAVPQNRSPDSENAILKTLYDKYLRAESFRKALVFQKKYLLLLLRRFQENEEATVRLLACMAGCPSFRYLETVTSRPKGSTRFRIAARVFVAVWRMKYLVRRWHQVKGSGPININRDGFGQSQGGLELYGDIRQMSYHSRSDLDLPRSPLPFNRYQGTIADLNTTSLTYSQLQRYNPGRTLTDYITQMESLQRRLGSCIVIQSGSPSFQFHSGMRR